EYVLCNEAMIAHWSIGTQESIGAIAQGAAIVERLIAAIGPGARASSSKPLAAWNAEVARAVWPGPSVGLALDPAWEAQISFPNEGYRLDAEHLTALLQKLRGITVHGPALAFAPRPDLIAAARAAVEARAAAAASAAAPSAEPAPSAQPPKRRRRGGTYG